MKHSILILYFVAMAMYFSFDANAQGLVYTPFIPNQSSSSGYGSYNRPSHQTQTIRTTAYYADYNGNYYKVPIKVEYTVYSNGATSLTVAEQWEGNGYGGQWKRIMTMANVMNCQPLTANGASAGLERNFMYKAMVLSKWYYFDL